MGKMSNGKNVKWENVKWEKCQMGRIPIFTLDIIINNIF